MFIIRFYKFIHWLDNRLYVPYILATMKLPKQPCSKGSRSVHTYPSHAANKSNKRQTRFNIKLHAPTVVLLYLSTRKYVQSSMYPHFTLLGQSLGSLIVAFDGFNLLVPDIFIDTIGYAFTIALSKYLFPSVPTVCCALIFNISSNFIVSCLYNYFS